ncbi:GNAT family N-acetyltransferase [archaeon]|nr:GNAT family N-acetyltransferase [archaeon]
MNFCILPMDFNDFKKWYEELGKLKIFWAKPLSELKLVSREDESCTIEISWMVRKKVQSAIMLITSEPSKVFEKFRNKYRSSVKLAMVHEDFSSMLFHFLDAKSILYFWDVRSRVLEGNSKVKIVKLFEWNESYLKTFRKIHKKSWGFFIPPRENDHIVILAYLGSTPVGMAYLNKNNFNIDYGVHVVKEFWRNRIGTRVLEETLEVAKQMNASYVSVVRVLRSTKILSADRRAISFYKANKPFLRLSICRLKP